MNTRATRLAGIALALAGCNNGTTVTVTKIDPGAQCPNGGVEIKGGGQPQVVCNGTNGSSGTNAFTTLVTSTALPPGDATCPAGGVRIDSGLDNGAGGGTASDGILQKGEVLSSETICNGDTGARPGSLTPPSGPAGAFTIQSVGGAGTSGAGSGGSIGIQLGNGSYGGNVKLFRTGLADASFTFPAVPPPTVGSALASITSDTTITPQISQAPGLAPGTLFTFSGGLYADSGSETPATQITGLFVSVGVTATFAMGAGTSVSVFIPQSCVNKGKIVAGQTTTVGQTGSLALNCGDYFGDTGSSISTAGLAGSASAAGGNAGFFILDTGSFWNKGSIDTSGGAGAPGGNGNFIDIRSGGPVFNTGRLDSSGGTAPSADSGGGSAGSIRLVSSGDLNNSGNVDASGGGGNNGGAANSVNLEAGFSNADGPSSSAVISIGNTAGSLRNSGNVTSHGGDSLSGCASNCNGSSGSSISLIAFGGLLTSTGSLTATGGAGGSGDAGSGGGISVQVQGPNSGSSVLLPGNLTLSGNIDSSGGAGANAGGAGGVSISLDTQSQPDGQEIILYGYTSLVTDGGASPASAGSSGSITITNGTGAYGGGNVQVPGGSIVNYCDLSARGGVSSDGNAGSGGNIDIETQSREWFPGPQFEMALNAGSIDASGGDGGNQAGGNGRVFLYGRDGTKNVGAISAAGGNGIGTNSTGGNGGTASLSSGNGQVNNNSTINVSAGSSQGDSGTGSGGQITLLGYGTVDSGTLLAAGGAADPTAGIGGAGGIISISSYTGLSSVTAAQPGGMVVSGGTGQTTGVEGTISIDGRLVTDSWTH